LLCGALARRSNAKTHGGARRPVGAVCFAVAAAATANANDDCVKLRLLAAFYAAMNRLRFLAGSGFCALAFVCSAWPASAQQTAFAPASSASTPAPVASQSLGPGQAVLYIVNDSGPTLMSSNQDITDNGEQIASLPRQTYVKLDIAGGHHEFRFKPFPQGKRVATLDAQAGQIYYLLVGYSPGRSWGFPFGGDPMTIRLIDEEQAAALMKGMKPL
jgi:hypothetical protein